MDALSMPSTSHCHTAIGVKLSLSQLDQVIKKSPQAPLLLMSSRVCSCLQRSALVKSCSCLQSIFSSSHQSPRSAHLCCSLSSHHTVHHSIIIIMICNIVIFGSRSSKSSNSKSAQQKMFVLNLCVICLSNIFHSVLIFVKISSLSFQYLTQRAFQ